MDLKELKMLLQTPVFLLRSYISEMCIKHHFKIVRYPFDFYDNEDRLACFIFDFYHFPFDQVMERFEKEGGKIVKLQE